MMYNIDNRLLQVTGFFQGPKMNCKSLSQFTGTIFIKLKSNLFVVADIGVDVDSFDKSCCAFNVSMTTMTNSYLTM